jgi:hypothetical protein
MNGVLAFCDFEGFKVSEVTKSQQQNLKKNLNSMGDDVVVYSVTAAKFQIDVEVYQKNLSFQKMSLKYFGANIFVRILTIKNYIGTRYRSLLRRIIFQ